MHYSKLMLTQRNSEQLHGKTKKKKKPQQRTLSRNDLRELHSDCESATVSKLDYCDSNRTTNINWTINYSEINFSR